MDSSDTSQHRLEELNLIQYSLLPGEAIAYISPRWEKALAKYQETGDSLTIDGGLAECCPRIAVEPDDRTEDDTVEVEVTYPATLNIRGPHVSRTEQEGLQDFARETLQQLLSDSSVEYPIYELLCSHLLPKLHVMHKVQPRPSKPDSDLGLPLEDKNANVIILHHALLTSHHLLSSTKRRTMANLSSELSLSGFAKLGYPGVMYCYCYTIPSSSSATVDTEGAIRQHKNNARVLGQHSENIANFVQTVKSMNWLALRVRFIEDVALGTVDELRQDGGRRKFPDDLETKANWVEFEKVGEVVEHMKNLGRERFVTDLGIGSGGS